MTLFHRIVARASENHGLVTSAEALAEGGSNMAVVMLARRGAIEPVARGIFRVPGMVDERTWLQEAILRVPGAVLSHDTSLELLDLATVMPSRVHITIEGGRRLRGKLPDWIEIHRASLDPQDVMFHDGLATTTPARTIVDAVEDDLGRRFVDEALAAAMQKKLLSDDDRERVRLAIGSHHQRP